MNTSFGNIKAVAKRELIGYFSSPVAYVFLTMFLLLSGFFTFMVGRAPFFEFQQASLVTFFIWLPWLFLFLVPAVGMRLWSEERRLGTIELLPRKLTVITSGMVRNSASARQSHEFRQFPTIACHPSAGIVSST